MKAFRGFWAILYKEWIVMFRDPATLFFMFFPPLMQIVAFGFALDMDVKNMPLVVLDEDRTAESRAAVDRFVNTGAFKYAGAVRDVEEMRTRLRRGQAMAALQIPPDYTRNLHAGRKATLQVLVDGSSSSPAMQALNTAVALGFRQSAAALLGSTGRLDPPVEVRPQVLYNPELRSPNFYVPGVIGIALQIATVFATAMSIVRERERGTIEQLLVSPLSRGGLMLGKLIPYFCMSFTMALCLLAILRFVFFIPVAGPLGLIVLGAALYVFALLSLGLLISSRAQNQMMALQMTVTLMLPAIFFSGFIFPRETMPWIFYAMGSLMPATYFIDLTRSVILRGAGWADGAGDLAVLAAMGAAIFALAAARLRTRMA